MPTNSIKCLKTRKQNSERADNILRLQPLKTNNNHELYNPFRSFMNIFCQ